jgi:uncharacterized lipoprotein YajG
MEGCMRLFPLALLVLAACQRSPMTRTTTGPTAAADRPAGTLRTATFALG